MRHFQGVMAKGSRIESKNDGANTKINRNTRLRVGSGITEKGSLSTCGQCIQCIHLLEGNMSEPATVKEQWPTADPPNITFKLLRAATSEEGNKDLTLGRGNTKGRSSGRGSKRVQTATMQIWPSRRVRSLERVCVCQALYQRVLHLLWPTSTNLFLAAFFHKLLIPLRL